MKVAVLTTSFPRWAGDFFGNYIFYVAAEHAKKGAEIRVVAPHANAARGREWLDGVEVRRFRYAVPASMQVLAYGGGIFTNLQNSLMATLQLPIFFLSFFARSFWVVRWSDVVHAHWTLAGVIAVILGWVMGKRVVLTLYGIEVFTRRWRLLTAFCIRASDHVVCISTATLSETEQIGRPKAFSVIPFGIGKEFAGRAECFDVRARHSIPTNAAVVFSLGRLIKRKGTKYLIQAIPDIAMKCPVHVIIGGEGPERTRLERFVDGLGLQGLVTFTGKISAEELPSYYRQSDIFVHPVITDASGDVEGLGIVLLEAMSVGTPVVASAIGGVTDIVVDGEMGYLVPEKDVEALATRVSALVRDPELCRSMGSAGRRRVEQRFRLTHLADMTMQIYSGLVGRLE